MSVAKTKRSKEMTDAADRHVSRAITDIYTKAGGEMAFRPLYPGHPELDALTVPEPADPLAAAVIARDLIRAAAAALAMNLGMAREKGSGWDAIGAELGFTSDPGESAFRLASPALDAVGWRCGSCGLLVTDRGPFSGPADDETGHADDCERHAADMAAWEAGWDEFGDGESGQ
jgi:hypothetical protein